jgi:hypothetical protein
VDRRFADTIADKFRLPRWRIHPRSLVSNGGSANSKSHLVKAVMLARKTIIVAAITSVRLIVGCKMKPEKQKQNFSKVTEDFVYGSLALSPVSATQARYHEHQGVRLDEKLDDFSPSGIEATRKFYAGFKDRLAAIDQASLSAEERADYQIIQNAIDLSLLYL